jgi:hypothetical protein
MKVSFAVIAKHFRRFDKLWGQIHSLPQNGPEFEVVIILDNNYDPEFDLPKFDSARKYNKSLNGSFSSMRNYALGKCFGDWVFHIDTDELLPKNFVEGYEGRFWDVVALSSCEIFGFPRINNFTNESDESNSLIKHNWPDFQNRLHKRVPGILWTGEIHETLTHCGFPYRATQFSKSEDNAIIHEKTIAEQHQSDRLYSEKFNKLEPVKLEQ